MAKTPKETQPKDQQSTALTTFVPAATLSAKLESLGAQLTPIGMTLPSGLNIDECCQIVGAVHDFKTTFDGSYRWSVGDVLSYSQSAFGDQKYIQVAAQIEMDYQDVRNCIWVSRAIPLPFRVAGLSWSHHRLVAGDDIPSLDEKHSLLLEARDNKLSVASFRQWLESKKVVEQKATTPSSPPPSVKATPPPPQSIHVTSFQAVAQWIQNASSASEIEWCISTLLTKVQNLNFLGKLSLEIEKQSIAVGTSIGLVGMPDANAEEDDETADLVLDMVNKAEKDLDDEEDEDGDDDDDEDDEDIDTEVAAVSEIESALTGWDDDDDGDDDKEEEEEEDAAATKYVDLDETGDLGDLGNPPNPWEI